MSMRRLALITLGVAVFAGRRTEREVDSEEVSSGSKPIEGVSPVAAFVGLAPRAERLRHVWS
jgi:hypothetical protein